jgi:hypothetical protein
MPPAPVVMHAPEWVMFTLANVIIWYFCAGRLLDDVRRWRGGGR